MIIRCGGGNSGIAEYLITGNKLGRELSRNELDNRIVLDGDLSLTDTIIDSIDNKGQERYLHITLSFKEDIVDIDTLRAVTEDYKKYLFSAFKEDEFNFYAEAHLPKVKSIINNMTGELVDRKPHIHIVIPKVNMLSGKYLDPIGLYKNNTLSFQAIQEKINIDYDLMSPTEYVRTTNNNDEQILARVTGSLLSEKNNKIKQEIAEYIITNKINSFEEFTHYLSSLGEVKTRNQGKDNEYKAIKLPNESRFINLKSPVFSKEFIEKGVLKSSKLSVETVNKQLNEWIETRSLEVKHISNASSKVKTLYQSLDFNDKMNFLVERERKHEQRYRGNKKTDNQSNLTSFGRKNLPTFTRSVQDLPKLKLDSRERGQERPEKISIDEFLHGNESRSMGNVQSERVSSLRWNDIPTDPSNARERGINDCSSLNQVIYDNKEIELLHTELGKEDFAIIRKNLNANLLIERLKETHLLTGNFTINKAKDGSDRIHSNNRNYNVSDFLTKVMNFTWDEAKNILSETYSEQQKISEKSIDDLPKFNNKELWKLFIKEELPLLKESYKKDWLSIKERYKEGAQIILNEYKHKRQSIRLDKKLSKEEKAIQRSISTYQKITAIKALKSVFANEKEAFKLEQKTTIYYFNDFKERYNMGILDQYKTQDLVLSTGAETVAEQLENVKKEKLNIKKLLEQDFYQVGDSDSKGNVTYLLNNGEKAFVDKGDSIEVSRIGMSEDKVAAALEMAIAKYGNTLTLSGNEKFKEMLIDVASRTDHNLTLKPEKYNVELREAKERYTELAKIDEITIDNAQQKIKEALTTQEIVDVVDQIAKLTKSTLFIDAESYMEEANRLEAETGNKVMVSVLKTADEKCQELMKEQELIQNDDMEL